MLDFDRVERRIVRCAHWADSLSLRTAKNGGDARLPLYVSASIILFGTIIFPYSTMLFAHVPAALFLLLAVTLSENRPVAAGIAAGLAASCFYVCACSPVGNYLPITRTRYPAPAPLYAFLLGALPFVVLMAIYQWLCFGSPFLTSVEASTPIHRTAASSSASSNTFADGAVRHHIVAISRPVLRLADFIAGIRRIRRHETQSRVLVRHRHRRLRSSWRLRVQRLEWRFRIRPALSGSDNSAAGHPDDGGKTKAALLWIAAAIFSVGLNFIATATDPMPSSELQHPVSRYLVPAFFTGHIGERTRREVGMVRNAISPQRRPSPRLRQPRRIHFRQRNARVRNPDRLMARRGLRNPLANVTSSAAASARRIAARPGRRERTAPCARRDGLRNTGCRPARRPSRRTADRRLRSDRLSRRAPS